jgi:DNA processing protein
MSVTVRIEPPHFPPGVRELPDPPAELFLTGKIPPGPRVALVGTRRPTAQAFEFTEQLALELAEAGIVIVSGGAVGIDTAAHQGALRAGGGTLVVAPSSYSCPYPEQNEPLFRQIVECGGGHLTFVGQATKAQRHAFFARNALLVSLCSTLVLVQAPHRSGARNATLWARKLRRTYWVVPHPPWCSSGAASVGELRLGGKALACSKDIRNWLAARSEHAVPPVNPVAASGVNEIATQQELPRPGHDLTQAGRPSKPCEPHRDVCRLVAALRAGPKHPDELCQALDWVAARLHSTVLHATLMGETERLASGQVALCGSVAR